MRLYLIVSYNLLKKQIYLNIICDNHNYNFMNTRQHFYFESFCQGMTPITSVIFLPLLRSLDLYV